jgi:hypothetical protein
LPKAEVPEPQLSAGAFKQRCLRLSSEFSTVIGVPRDQVAFAPEITNTEAAMTLGGRASEVISRNRGRPHRVVPLAPLSDDLVIWTGYREAWQKQGSEQNFRFVDGGFTLHLGRVGEITKPQILRSEWVGRRSRAFVEVAGHPHWQLDVLETIRATTVKPPVGFGEPDVPPPVIDFDSAEAIEEPHILTALTIENMHLASAAMWWRTPEKIAHVAETVAELDRWMLGCAAYLRQEVARCQFRPTEVR